MSQAGCRDEGHSINDCDAIYDLCKFCHYDCHGRVVHFGSVRSLVVSRLCLCNEDVADVSCFVCLTVASGGSFVCLNNKRDFVQKCLRAA